MRVTYDQEMRKKAKDAGEGLITIDIIQANGCRSTMQIMASDKATRYAYRALNHVLDVMKKEDE